MEQDTLKKKPGPVAGIETIKSSLMLEPEVAEWAKHQPGGLSATVRRLMRVAYEKELKASVDKPE